jgi:hypothetical protein
MRGIEAVTTTGKDAEVSYSDWIAFQKAATIAATAGTKEQREHLRSGITI